MGRAMRRTSASPPIITFSNLFLGYGEASPALRDLNATVTAGSLTALVGPNGAGKSTLLKGIIGALPPLNGRIILSGIRATDIAYLPQSSEIDRTFPISVRDFVAGGLWRQTGAFGRTTALLEKELSSALETVGLGQLADRHIGTLSGGQFRRVLFSRLVLQDASVILLDEPFASVDAQTASDLLQLVQTWYVQGRTVIAAIHDLEEVRTHFPETILLAGEIIASGATARVLTAESLTRAGLKRKTLETGGNASGAAARVAA